MNNKTAAISACVIGVILYAGFLMSRESPDEKYERFRAARNAPATPDFSAENAYLLTVTFLSGVVSDSQSAIRDAILDELRDSIKPLGVNPATGRRAGGGRLGTISVRVDAQCQGYKGGSPGSFYSIPRSMNLALTVRSAGGWSSWDGEMKASASIAPPTSVSDAGFYSTQKREVGKLTKKVFSQINSQKRFVRN